MDYLRALLKLSPILRRRLEAVAKLADITELEALQIIVENSEGQSKIDSTKSKSK